MAIFLCNTKLFPTIGSTLGLGSALSFGSALGKSASFWRFNALGPKLNLIWHNNRDSKSAQCKILLKQAEAPAFKKKKNLTWWCHWNPSWEYTSKPKNRKFGQFLENSVQNAREIHLLIWRIATQPQEKYIFLQRCMKYFEKIWWAKESEITCSITPPLQVAGLSV